MNIKEFRTELNELKTVLGSCRPTLVSNKGNSISVMLDNIKDINVGIHLSKCGDSLEVTRYQKQPYKQQQLLSLFNMTSKQEKEALVFIANVSGNDMLQALYVN